jgi:hypothetical protein
MKRGAAGAFTAVLLLVGCSSGTPDTEGQTLFQAQQTLRDAGVPAENITVTGETGDPDTLIVCDHDPDGVAPSQPLTLDVATNCPQDDDSDKKHKKKKRR